MSLSPTTTRWLRRIGIAFAVLVVIVVGGLWWLLGTRSGLQFALARVTAASNGAITVKAAHGDLAGPLQLDGVSYHDPDAGIEAHLQHIKADIALWSLLAGRVHLTDLEVSGVNVAMTTPAHKPSKSSSFALKPPLDVVLDHARLTDIRISQDGKPAFVVNSLVLAGAWTSAGVTISQLELHAPKGQAQLAGRLALARHASGKGHASFQWTLDGTTWAGTLNAASNGREAHLVLALSQPMTATLHMTLQQRGKLPWTATLEAPTFDTRPILGASSIRTLALALKGHGNRAGGTLTGNIDVNQTRLHLEPLQLHYAADTQTVTLERLVLTSPQIQGTLAGHGTINLAATPARADLTVQWHDVRFPKDMVGQTLASAGNVTLTGSTDEYHLQGRVSIGPPGRPAHLALDLAGTPTVVTLKHLTIRQPEGNLDTHGTVTLKPRLAWNLVVKGKHFNPGLVLAKWKGALDIDLATQGHLTSDGPDATFKLAKLAGHLRQRKLSGHGKLHVTPERIINGKLTLASGASRITLDAHGKQTNHIDLALAIDSLNDWLPGASGSLRGQVDIDGRWPKLAVVANVHGKELGLGTRRVGAFVLTADVPDISHPGGTLNLKASKLAADGFAFQTVTVTGKGNAAHHTLELSAQGEPLSLQLALTGSMHGKAWNGTLSTLKLDFADLSPWHLQQPAQLAWNRGAASISETCLTAGTPVLCMAAQKARDGTLHASYKLEQIPLALVATIAGEGLPLTSKGVINGEGTLSRSAAGALSGHATLISPKGSISYPDRPDLPLLAYNNFRAEATLAPQRQHITVTAAFRHGGHLEGNVNITGDDRALSGEIAMRLDSLAPIELFTNMLADVKGHLDADFRLGGTLAQPVLDGQAALAQFAAEVPAAGLKLHDGRITVATTSPRQWRIDGHITSGSGTLQLAGTLGLGDQQPTQLRVHGKKILAADIPAAKVTLSPDLTIERNAKGLALTGSVLIDKTLVKLEKLPGAGATQASPDVVVVDAKKPPQENAALRVRADLTVDLGKDTHLVGYGLDGQVSGKLHVHTEPGKATTGRGQIVINGTYKAYGQDLTIKEGRLLFASTPIDNPGLDIRAVRPLHPNATISDNQVVGLQISGTAKHPVMTVFSNPTMEQADALSYLITGKPLSEVGAGEGSVVDAAAQALGSVAGNLLAKGIGARLGIEAGVSSNVALGTTAFTVGKYLSPRLYLSYGVGLFDPGQVITLRYILSSHWNFEAEQATDFSRASFNYRYEH